MEKQKSQGFQLIELDPNMLEVHELAALNPLMPADQYAEFIKQFSNGFDKRISHVVLYKNKVVDGRHRLRVCKELGIKLWGRNLPGTMTTQEVEEFVEGTENRRHQTTTQRAIGAYKYYAANSVSQEVAATKKLSTRRDLARAKTLHDLVGSELIDKLHNGDKLKIVNPTTGLPTITDSLVPLINYFTNRNAELVPATAVNSDLTDVERELAMTKYAELQLECNMLVLRKIGALIYANDKKLCEARG